MKICSYHGNLYFDSFKLHVNEMNEKGFDTILFCITEADMLYNLDIYQEFRIYAESQNLQCLCTFWGLTAGEAVCKECCIEKWLKAVKGIGFSDIFIDEPKTFTDIGLFTDNDKYFCYHLCLADNTFNAMSDQDIINMPVKTIGVSCYHWVKDWMKITGRTDAITKRLQALRPHDNFLFVQGFDIPEGWELIPLVVKEVAEINGITNFGFWSFRCTEGTASKRPVNHKQIWQTIKF